MTSKDARAAQNESKNLSEINNVSTIVTSETLIKEMNLHEAKSVEQHEKQLPTIENLKSETALSIPSSSEAEPTAKRQVTQTEAGREISSMKDFSEELTGQMVLEMDVENIEAAHSKKIEQQAPAKSDDRVTPTNKTNTLKSSGNESKAGVFLPTSIHKQSDGISLPSSLSNSNTIPKKKTHLRKKLPLTKRTASSVDVEADFPQQSSPLDVLKEAASMMEMDKASKKVASTEKDGEESHVIHGEPLDRDILCGRGRGFFCHDGNQRMLSLVREQKANYKTAPKSIKARIVKGIMEILDQQNARFLKKSSSGESWYEVPESEKFKKICHALREEKNEGPPTRKFSTFGTGDSASNKRRKKEEILENNQHAHPSFLLSKGESSASSKDIRASTDAATLLTKESQRVVDEKLGIVFGDPNPSDVLFGQDPSFFSHPGNAALRQYIEANVGFPSMSPHAKAAMARHIVNDTTFLGFFFLTRQPTSPPRIWYKIKSVEAESLIYRCIEDEEQRKMAILLQDRENSLKALDIHSNITYSKDSNWQGSPAKGRMPGNNCAELESKECKKSSSGQNSGSESSNENSDVGAPIPITSAGVGGREYTEDELPEGIGLHDVVCARGKGAFRYPGNRQMLTMFWNFKEKYNSASKSKKAQIGRNIIENIKSRGGRFLKRNGKTWEELDGKAVLRKVCHGIRDIPNDPKMRNRSVVRNELQSATPILTNSSSSIEPSSLARNSQPLSKFTEGNVVGSVDSRVALSGEMGTIRRVEAEELRQRRAHMEAVTNHYARPQHHHPSRYYESREGPVSRLSSGESLPMHLLLAARHQAGADMASFAPLSGTREVAGGRGSGRGRGQSVVSADDLLRLSKGEMTHRPW